MKILIAHEGVGRRSEGKGGSDRSFGLVFACAFLAIALLPAWKGHAIRIWALPIAALFLVLALAKPSILTPLNRYWTRLGILLGKVVGPIAAGVLFFGVVTPVGVLMRLSGKDPLKLRFERETGSYWVARDPKGPTPESMANQF
ncbi:SxtJ family membrane protein [uncultured Paludibaculum sp.]|uniref:SxtJ family membrane protein n=1 Tax=uncultured Paludibaculum sp. TaxID=1765020 RepID=UPI00374D5D35